MKYGHMLKKQNKIKVWTAIDRNGNRRNKNSNSEFSININKNNNENIICRKLLNKILNINDDNMGYYKNHDIKYIL